MGLIYQARNLLNGKVYIGKTELTLEERKHAHLRDCNHKKSRFYTVLKSHPDLFEWSIVEDGVPSSSLNDRERHWIAFCRSTDKGCGYNMTAGGTGGDIISQLPNSAEIRERQKEAVRQANPTRKLRSIREVWIERYGLEDGTRRYAEMQEKRGAAISKGKTGKTYSAEHCAAISKSLLGRKHPKTQSKEEKT